MTRSEYRTQSQIALRTRPDVYIVIPAYNESHVIRSVVERVLLYAINVVVVDDCSTDSSINFVQDLPITILRHAINLGQGAAIQTGVDYAVMHDARYVVTFDSDGQHDEQDIPRLIAALEENNLDIVLGSRFLGRAENMTTTRKWTLKAAILFTRLTTGLRLTDVHNGLRAFRAGIAPKLRISQDRMAHASEILSNIHRHELAFAEVPCTIRYTRYSKQKGQSAFGAFDIVYDLFLRLLRK